MLTPHRTRRELDHPFKVGRILTGDRFVNDPTYTAACRSELKGSCIDMEAAAVAQTCAWLKIPWLVVRVISDKADHSSPVDFPTFLPKAAATLDRLVRGITAQLD